METVQLVNYKNDNLITEIEWIAEQVLQGKITGICIVFKEDRFKHSSFVLGDYKQDPYCALRIIEKMQDSVVSQIDSVEEATETTRIGR